MAKAIASDTKHEEDERMLDTAGAAEILAVAPHTLVVWRTTRRHNLAYRKIGRSVRYLRRDVIAFRDSNVVGGETTA